MDAPTMAAVRRLDALAVALAQVPVIGAEAYANGKFGARPIVERHFTAGNHARYGWAPLTRDYAREKAGKAKALRGQMRKAGRTMSKLDPAVPFSSSTGTLRGFGAGANLPMLVRTGDLRTKVVSPTLHTIAMRGETAVVTFSGLPKYADFHHLGMGHNPKRSPVEPGMADIDEVRAACRRFIDGMTGKGGYLQTASRSVPGATRVV